eukprot:scaffold431_cov334-Pavlova_lutheri.AAC.85
MALFRGEGHQRRSSVQSGPPDVWIGMVACHQQAVNVSHRSARHEQAVVFFFIFPSDGSCEFAEDFFLHHDEGRSCFVGVHVCVGCHHQPVSQHAHFVRFSIQLVEEEWMSALWVGVQHGTAGLQQHLFFARFLFVVDPQRFGHSCDPLGQFFGGFSPSHASTCSSSMFTPCFNAPFPFSASIAADAINLPNLRSPSISLLSIPFLLFPSFYSPSIPFLLFPSFYPLPSSDPLFPFEPLPSVLSTSPFSLSNPPPPVDRPWTVGPLDPPSPHPTPKGAVPGDRRERHPPPMGSSHRERGIHFHVLPRSTRVHRVRKKAHLRGAREGRNAVLRCDPDGWKGGRGPGRCPRNGKKTEGAEKETSTET